MLRRLILPVALLCFLGAGLALAQTPPAGGATTNVTDLYTTTNGGMAIPSGDINVVPGDKDLNKALTDTAITGDEPENLLGCGGVGQGDYTSAIYNMDESFEKFQQDVNSNLAKQLVSLNFVMPQTAALFDQLNNYGNQRYAAFQRGCSLTALQQDAKAQYMKACMAKIDRESEANKADLGNAKNKDEQKKAIAYAQSWEICANQYAGEQDATTVRKTTLEAFATKIRELENVTKAIAPFLCGEADECWQTLLIPQVRLCLGEELSKGCAEGADDYKVTEPLLPMPRLFDAFRYIIDDLVVARRVNNVFNQLDEVSDANRKLAASEAGLALSNATLGRMNSAGTPGGAPTLGKEAASNSADDSIKAFQYNYLNCKTADILHPVQVYASRVNLRLQQAGTTTGGTGGTSGGTTTNITVPALAVADYTPVITGLAIDGASSAQTDGLKDLAWSALGCAANQNIPIFDPNIMASLQSQCLPQDRYAFYSMAEYDVALTAAQNVYRYLTLRLKQVYAQLLTNATVPGEGSDNAETAVYSKELNARLAQVVKEAMIPQVESQLDRLNELAATRGAFAQRVQQIYNNKTGCVYTATGGSPGRGAAGAYRSRSAGSAGR